MAPAALLQDSYPLGEPGMSHWAHMKTTLAFLAAFGFPCWAHPRRAVGGGWWNGAGGVGNSRKGLPPPPWEQGAPVQSLLPQDPLGSGGWAIAVVNTWALI